MLLRSLALSTVAAPTDAKAAEPPDPLAIGADAAELPAVDTRDVHEELHQCTV
jgi:hypothetical protein